MCRLICMQTTTNLNVCICIHTYQYICTSVHMLEGQPIDAANVLHIQLHTFLHLHIHGTRNMTLFLASRIYTVYIYTYIHIHVWLWLKLIDCNTRNTVHNPFCNPFRTHFFCHIYIYIYTLVLCLYVDAWMLFSYWRILFLDQVGN